MAMPRPHAAPGAHARTAIRPVTRAWVALCMALVLLLQLWAVGYQATAVAAGIEVCSSSGSRLVDGKGEPLPSKGHHAGHGDCCCGAVVPPLPAQAVAPMQNAEDDTPAALLSTRRLSAEWLAPLSRGPPVHA